jgi:hypothetical protein
MPSSCTKTEQLPADNTAEAPQHVKRAEIERGAPAAVDCYLDCTFPWETCYSTCRFAGIGSGRECALECNCNMFSDPNSQCRKDGGQ